MNKLYFVLILFFTGCAALNTGYIYPSAEITNSNFKYIKTVSANSSVSYFLGIGGFSKSGLIAKTKTKIYNEAKLSDGQVLANVTVDFQTSTFLLIYAETKVIITADIIEFTNDDNTTKTYSSNNKTNEFVSVSEYKDFKIGDQVHFKIGVKTTNGKIIGFNPPQITVEYISDNGTNTKELDYDKVFHLK